MKLSERMRKIQIWSTKNARPVKETIICWADEVAQLEEENVTLKKAGELTDKWVENEMAKNATLKRENEGLKAVNKAGKL